MDQLTPAFQTNPPEQAETPQIRLPVRYFVVDAIGLAGADASLVKCHTARRDASDVGKREWIIAGLPGVFHSVGDLILATKPQGGAALSYNGGGVSWVEIGAPPIGYCKISYDFSDTDLLTNQGAIYAVPCTKTGTALGGGNQYLFHLTGHTTQLQGYCNLLAGHVVRYHPYPVVPGFALGSVLGMLAHLPLVATTSVGAVLQVSVAPATGTTGGRIVFDYVRSHS